MARPCEHEQALHPVRWPRRSGHSSGRWPTPLCANKCPGREETDGYGFAVRSEGGRAPTYATRTRYDKVTKVASDPDTKMQTEGSVSSALIFATHTPQQRMLVTAICAALQRKCCILDAQHVSDHERTALCKILTVGQHLCTTNSSTFRTSHKGLLACRWL